MKIGKYNESDLLTSRQNNRKLFVESLKLTN